LSFAVIIQIFKVINIFDLGEVTTPQIHYKVRATNDSSYGPVSSYTKRFMDAVDLFDSVSLFRKFLNILHFSA
jgi:hypothetical protein